MLLEYQKVKDLIEKGETLESVAEELGVNKTDIHKFCKKFKIKRQNSGRRKGVTNKDIEKKSLTFLDEFWKIIKNKI